MLYTWQALLTKTYLVVAMQMLDGGGERRGGGGVRKT